MQNAEVTESAAKVRVGGIFTFLRSETVLVVVLAAIVLLPRAALLSHALSGYCDDPYHLRRGMMFLSRSSMQIRLNDPPLGEAITALPIWILGCRLDTPMNPATTPPVLLKGEAAPESLREIARVRGARKQSLFGQPLTPEAMLMVTGLWKALLFLPCVAVVFLWCRSLYGRGSAWIAAILLIVEPNFAAHIHSADLDTLGVDGIVISCWLAWRYFERPSGGRLICTAVMTAVAMLIKHTALILPGVLLLMSMPYALRGSAAVRPGTQSVDLWRSRVNALGLAALVWLASMWVLSGFDYSSPYDRAGALFKAVGKDRTAMGDWIDTQLLHRWPAGNYIGSVVEGINHANEGHWGYLLGENRDQGWWYYFPAVATYKVPIGVAATMLLALGTLVRVRPRFEELSLAIPAVAWTLLVLTSHLNIGFRHALPAYLFILMIGSRAVVVPVGRMRLGAAWAAVIATGLHGLSYHPDYIAYLNWPRAHAYLDMSDSNLDWGQSLVEIRQWIDANAKRRDVYVRYFWDDTMARAEWYLGSRARLLPLDGERPDHGLLIISPVWVAGVYDQHDNYGALRGVDPVAIVGHTVRVYDLDHSFKQGFHWLPLRMVDPRTDVHHVIPGGAERQ